MSPKRHWAVLETFLAIAAEEEVDPSIWWVETRDAAKHPTVHGTAPQLRGVWPQMPVVTS